LNLNLNLSICIAARNYDSDEDSFKDENENEDYFAIHKNDYSVVSEVLASAGVPAKQIVKKARKMVTHTEIRRGTTGLQTSNGRWE